MHGNIDLYHKIKNGNNRDSYIYLLGDLLDSWIFPIEDQIALVEEVLQDIMSGYGVTCLLGNHELSYLIPKRMRCSGYNVDTDFHLEPFKKDMMKVFKPFDVVDGILLTHAGVSNQFVRKNYPKDIGDPTLEGVCEMLDKSWKNQDRVLDIGFSRGGNAKEAGIFWNDWYQDFIPIYGIRQIFGHTPATEICKKGDNWCIDCLLSTNHNRARKPMGLKITDGNVEKIELI